MPYIKAITPGLIMIIVSIIVLSQAFTMEKQSILDPSGGSFFPALIAIIMLLSGIITSIKGAQQLRTFSHLPNDKDDPSEEETKEEFTKKDFTFIFTFFIFIVIYVLLIPILTFYPATFLFFIGSMYFLKEVSWKMNLLVSLLSIVVIYLLFSVIFGIIFP